ncbi:hypothetical protein [Rathayibacter soli]|uniref:hypothetical protein n=1 Tax=Rathayibacter soli TaxID=3144168 RepID=UPI0027E3C14C|nr:hypothetical protein [Glaciibacter superstes]
MRARIAASVVLAVGILLGTAGCNFLAPQETANITETSDGVNGSVGSIDVRNATVISDNGRTGNLVVTLVNNDSKSHRVLIQHGTTNKVDTYVTVEPGQVKDIGSTTHPQTQLTNINTRPGALLPLYFQYGTQTGVQLLVPVLTSAQAEYQQYTPTPKPKVVIAVPNESTTPTPEPTATSNG